VTFVDPSQISNYENAIRPSTRVLYAETPCNPTMRVTDLIELGELASKSGTKLMVDSTFGSPYHQQPLLIKGVHTVIHSATKYLGGHSDITAGTVSSNDIPWLFRLGKVQKLFGGILPAFDAYLIIRGIKTLDVRMQRQSANALALAQWLQTHSKVEKVHYCGLPQHPDHSIAKKQMRNGFGAMMSFEVKGGSEAGRILVENVKIIKLAVSLGGVESLVVHPASTTHAMVTKEDRLKGGISDGLIRFSVGLEHLNDLIADLDQALKKT